MNDGVVGRARLDVTKFWRKRGMTIELVLWPSRTEC